MTGNTKVAFGGEWVKTNMRSRRFRVTGKCEYCGHCTVGAVWHSIHTGKTRCLRCFKPPLGEMK